jgi:hypothetical protein
MALLVTRQVTLKQKGLRAAIRNEAPDIAPRARGARYCSDPESVGLDREPANLSTVARTYRALDNPITGTSSECDFGPYAGDVVKWVV